MATSQAIAEFDALVQENDIIFIGFWAQWCTPCKQFFLVYEKVAKQFSEISFNKVDIEKKKEWVDFLGIRSVPHLLVIKNGLVIYSDAGNIAEKTLLDLALQALEIKISDT